MEIPEGLNENRSSRSKQLIPTEITLNKESRRIDIESSLNNQSKEHILIVSFPIGLRTEAAWWESPFEIRERKVDKFTNDFGKKGPELERQAMQNFIDISDNKNGVGLFTKGLKEVGTTNDTEAIINLTLFWVTSGSFPIHNDLLIDFENETSQCIGEQTFEYAIYFHKGEFRTGKVIEESRKYIIPLISTEIGIGKGGKFKGDMSFMKLKGDSLILCTTKLSEDKEGIIIRINNPTNQHITEEIEFMNEIREAYFVNMNEKISEKINLKDKKISIEIAPYKI